MAAFICRFCGAPLELAGGTVCECPNCNRMQSVPLIDSVEKRELIARAEQLRNERRFDTAVQLFEKMISLSPQDADLYWAVALCNFGVIFFYDGGIALLRTQAHSFLTDSDYLKAVSFADEKQRLFMERTAALIDEKRRAVSDVSAGTKYDVVLCCRDEKHDIELASSLYRKLTANNISAFLPQVNLDSKPRSEWQPYILGALDSAAVLLLAITGADCFSDPQFMEICRRFLSASGSERAVIPVLYDVSAEILPQELSGFQAVSAANLGFEQDIIASVNAIVLGRAASSGTEVRSPLVRRAFIMLSDGEFSEAAALCDRLEKQSPGEAALIRLLCEYRLSSEESLGSLAADITKSENFRLAMQYGGESMRLRLRKYALNAQDNLLAAKKQESDSAPLEFSLADELASSVRPISQKTHLSPLAIGFIAAGIAVACLIITVFCINNRPELPVTSSLASDVISDFDRAKSLYDEGKFAEAEAAFSSLNNTDWVNKCRYSRAEQLLSDGDYENARSIFTRLGDYSDSADRVLDCDFSFAEKLEAQGDYSRAAEIFGSLGSYLNSNSRMKNCIVMQASELFDSGDLDSAQALVEGLKGYPKGDELMKKILYVRAENKFDSGAYSSAYEMFDSLNGWSDSAARADEALYHLALSYMEQKRYTEAVSALADLDGYLDSAELLNEAWLGSALEKMDSGDKRKAYEILTFRITPEYSPAQPYINSLRSELLSGAGWSSILYFGKYDIYGFGEANSISWCVLTNDGSKALICPQSALEYLPFDESGSAAWSECSLRSWLNGDFYDNAFSESEKSLIVDSAHGGVTDRVFLLSYDETAAYFDRALSPDSIYATFYTQDKLPQKDTALVWGRDGIVSQQETDSGIERLTASPSESALVFPAVWVRIE